MSRIIIKLKQNTMYISVQIYINSRWNYVKRGAI